MFSSFKADMGETICQFVDCILPRFSPENMVLVMILRLEMRDIKNDKHQTRYARLLFWRPNNYMKVFWDELEKPVRSRLHSLPWLWELKCDHDSCWTTDGVSYPLGDIYLRMARQVNPKVAPASLDSRAAFHIVSGQPRLVRMKSWEYDKNARIMSVTFEE